MRPLDWKAILKGFAAYWSLLVPIHLLWRLALLEPLAAALIWLLYVAAFLGGLVFSYFSPSNGVRDCLVLGLAIALSHLLANPAVTATVSVAVDAVAISVFLVLAGSALGEFLGDDTKRT